MTVTSIPMSITLDDLAPGNYAIAIFQDLNGDSILNRNPLGIPTEPFGFSQNPRIVVAPPKFVASAVLVVEAETNVNIRLKIY
ncbi:MAG: DUF2141 domain-containing protein [Oscillatoriales cyanobacterium RM1_1_9]|nr:DUF2141 domain-containing protein [Oscillatoriales cyanobacterium RM1_1_9]